MLASIIAENKLDNQAHGWFVPPWRSGWNVAWLCIAIETRINPNPVHSMLVSEIAGWIAKHAEHSAERLSLIYQTADEYRAPGVVDRSAVLLALRAIQLEIAKSSGGGHVYNDSLTRLFIDLNRPTHFFADLVKQARCKDAIGVGVQLMNDRNDRLRRAFNVAWDRGLYRAVYALPQATGG